MILVYYNDAPRKGMRVEETERRLAPVYVGYDRGVSDAAARRRFPVALADPSRVS